MNKRAMLMHKLKTGEIIRLIGAHNGLSAKLGEKAGFDAIWASGFEISTSYCVPDANILSMTEFLHAADSMNKVINIPVIADCDSGFGDINNVIHLVKMYENANIAGICIEDKVFPKMNSFINLNQELVTVEEFSAKIIAAKAARQDQNFLIVARIESLIAGQGMEDALYRAKSYEKAGADAILIHSKSKNTGEILSFAKNYSGSVPLFIVPTTYYDLKIDDLYGTKIQAVIYANQGLRASIKAINNTYSSIISEKSSGGIEGKIASMSEVFDLQEMEKHNKNYSCYTDQAKKIVSNIVNEEVLQ